MFKIKASMFAIVVFSILILQSYTIATITRQQNAIESLIDRAEAYEAIYKDQNVKLWDLHDRVLALEAEDERLLAHIKWFVMRRSGTNELRKMEAAVARLEGVNDE